MNRVSLDEMFPGMVDRLVAAAENSVDPIDPAVVMWMMRPTRDENGRVYVPADMKRRAKMDQERIRTMQAITRAAQGERGRPRTAQRLAFVLFAGGQARHQVEETVLDAVARGEIRSQLATREES